MSVATVLRRVGRGLAAVLWFRIDGGWIYYAVLGTYGILVVAAVYVLSWPGWLAVLGALTILLDGTAVMLFLLHRWLNKRLGRRPREQ